MNVFIIWMTYILMTSHTLNRFTALFPVPEENFWTLWYNGKINRGRHTHHLAGCYSIRTNQCPPPPSPHIFYRSDALPAAKPIASKHWRHLMTS